MLLVFPESLIDGVDPEIRVKTEPHVWLPTNVAAKRCSNQGLSKLFLLFFYKNDMCSFGKIKYQ